MAVIVGEKLMAKLMSINGVKKTGCVFPIYNVILLEIYNGQLLDCLNCNA